MQFRSSKRQKELQRQEHQKEKEAKKAERAKEKGDKPARSADYDPDIAGIIPGPQPKPEDGQP
ncbi:MAG: hypothetical protein JST54_31205 [Deltaproteobacteria bacterium]|nr:hypothetical protein [Deltaproteobacteria bacterium]